MNFTKKILLFSLLVALTTAQSSRRSSSTRRKSSSSSNRAAAAAISAGEQERTLGLFGPLLRLGLGGLRGRPLRTGLQASSALSDPAYGGYYGGYPGSNSVYGNYGNYQNYGGVGYGGGYRPPVAAATYPNYNTGYNTGYQSQQSLGALSGLSNLGAYSNNGYASSAGVGQAGAGTAQQAQLASLLGQALGSSLRPLLNGGGSAGRYGTAAASASGLGQSANPFVGLLGLFG